MVFSGFRKVYFLTFFVLLVAWESRSQEAGAHYLLPGITQSSLFNPALQNRTDKLIIGIPFFSGIFGDWSSSVPVNSLFTEGFNYNIQRFYDALDEKGEGQALAGISLFYVSFKHNQFTFSLSVSERMVTSAFFDRGLVKFIRDGTEDYYGYSEDFGKGRFHFQHYRELALGASKTVWDGLDIGIRPKILFGRLFFDVRDFRLSAKTNMEKNELRMEPGGSFVLSGPFRHQYNALTGAAWFSANVKPGDYFFQPRNLGFAFDVGTIFRPNESVLLSFSLQDVGFIGYKKNTFNLDFLGPFKFNENSLYQSHSPEEENYLEPREALKTYSDLASYIVYIHEADSRAFTLLPFSATLSGKYHFSETISAGLSNCFSYFDKQPRNLFSVFLQAASQRKFEWGGSLTLINFSSIRPGLGMSYNANHVQFFFSSNNILGIVKPSASKHLNLYAGMNLLFDI